MATSQQVFLTTGPGVVLVHVHPGVVFTILDHFVRRNDGQERVIGALLGTVVENVVEVKNCLPVPHKDTVDMVFVDQEFVKDASSLHSRVYTKEVIVGWYSTGSTINESSALVHDFFGREVAQPVHMLVDTSMTNDKLDIKTYVSTALSVDDKAIGSTFREVACVQWPTEAERVGVDIMIRSQQLVGSEGRETNIMTDLESLEHALRNVLENIEVVSKYVDKVVTGEIVGDKGIGRFLADTVACMPKLDPESFDKAFNSSLQDMLLVAYLSNLARAQLAIMERLQVAT
eukprot:TRINITY_DN10412_c0_g1_i1.p1 TRINITY_DN10412_c0_g1~~TRINITY_DN10412_c0_g1_i1.p1  ORF type:complete len:288 (+),score=58.22 TRINITY_DN10412_c0_g1_i1:141-1004(+)